MKKFIQLFLLLIFFTSASAFAQSHHHSTHTGPRGGQYHYSKKGKKVYEKKNKTTTYHYKTTKKSSTYHYKPNSTYHYKISSHYTPTYKPSHYKSYSFGVRRNGHGKIIRSSSARHKFMVMTGYPLGRTGYVIDHIKPLKEGGCDCPENMQWQTKEEARRKDKWE